MDVVFAPAHRGGFFRVLQQTAHSQTAVMTIAPGEDGGPQEVGAAGRRGAGARRTARGRDRSS